MIYINSKYIDYLIFFFPATALYLFVLQNKSVTSPCKMTLCHIMSDFITSCSVQSLCREEFLRRYVSMQVLCFSCSSYWVILSAKPNVLLFSASVSAQNVLSKKSRRCIDMVSLINFVQWILLLSTFFVSLMTAGVVFALSAFPPAWSIHPPYSYTAIASHCWHALNLYLGIWVIQSYSLSFTSFSVN